MRKVMQSLLLGLAASSGWSATTNDTPATEEEQIREILSEGVNLYRSGRYDDAAYTLANAIAALPVLDPNAASPVVAREANRLLYEFYLAMGDRILMNMRDRAELEEVMESILRRARIYQRELRTTPEYINLLISKVTGPNEEERLVATTELVAIGPLAVPHLTIRLVDSTKDEERVWCRMVLTRMGYRAVMPLTEALNAADERLVTSVATILADIGDPRALPKLQQLRFAEESSETLQRVCENAVAAIGARAAYSEVPSAALLYFQEALRYFRDGDQVRDELAANQSLVWRWYEDREGWRKLHYDQTPGYAWNELVAEELVFDGLAVDSEFDAFHPLLVSVLEAQVVEANRRLAIARDRIAPPPAGIDVAATGDSVELLEARVAALEEMEDRVIAGGAEFLYRGIQQSIVSQRFDVAFHIMNLLRDSDLARAEALLPNKEEGLLAGKAGTVLVAALDHPERRVAYHAAATLAHLDPKLQFFNAERVVELLADAVGQWDMTTVLVIEPDFRHRNAARSELQSAGLLAFTAGDGFEGRLRLNEAPAKDAIIIAGDLTPALRDEHGVIIDVAEQTALGMVQLLSQGARTKDIPIFISLPADEELSVQIQNAFQELVASTDNPDLPVAGFVHRPYDGTELKGEIELATGDADLPSVNEESREAISKLAAEALAAIDPVRTQFDLSQAVESLMATIENRQDYVRIPALQAIGHIQPEGVLDRITEVYMTQMTDVPNALAPLPQVPETRAAFLYAIGKIDPTHDNAVAILLEALNAGEDTNGVPGPEFDANRVVRRAAAEALGHGGSLPGDLLDTFQRQERLDIRSLKP